MNSKLITIIHEVETDNPRDLLLIVRKLVKKARVENPEIKDYQLHDIGMIRQKNNVRINLYFKGKGEEFKRKVAQ